MRIILIVTLITLVHSVNAQSCFPDDLILSTQNDIDSFSIKYPNCTVISGNVRIATKEIKDLSGFNQIEIIHGNLNFGNTNLKSLGGFEKLRRIGGYISIAGNDSLTNLIGFPPLIDTIRTNFFINSNYNLSSLEGLENIEIIQGSLQIGWPSHGFDQPIKTMKGLSSLKEVRTLYLRNLALDSLTGLESLEHILRLHFQGLRNLESISAIENTDITGVILIQGSENLKNLIGLEGVQRLRYTLELTGLDQVKSLEPIKNIDLSQVNNIIISENENLSTCAVYSICQALKYADSILISNNVTGCNSVADVENQCMTPSANNLTKSLKLYPNPTYAELFLSENNLHYEILNSTGSVVQNGTVKDQSIQVQNLFPGIYILKVFKDQKVNQTKFVKK